MAKKKTEFDRRKAAFEQACEADEHDAVIREGEALIERFPDEFQADDDLIKLLSIAYNNRGNAYLGEGEYDTAIADYDKAIEINPDYAGAYGNRGIAYANKGEHDTAIANFDKVIVLNPDDEKAYNNRGNAYAEKEEYDNAIADYNTAIRLKPDFAEAYFGRGNAYADKGAYDKAIADYDKEIALNPDDVKTYHKRALVIGQQAAKETEERLIQKAKETEEQLKQSYEEQLTSISNPFEINEIYKDGIATSEAHLEDLRKEGKEVGENLWRKLGAVWGICLVVFALLIKIDALPVQNVFAQLLSFSFSVIFLSSPFIWRLQRVNHDIRVERHALEDFRRKWIMLLLRVAQGDEAMRNQHTADIIQHFDKRGTPEVLNRLYHPKYAYPHKNNAKDEGEGKHDDEKLLKRMEAMLKPLIERSE